MLTLEGRAKDGLWVPSLACVGFGDGVCGCVPSARIVVFVSDALASWPCLMCLCVGEEFAWVVDVQFTISHFVSLPAECRAHRRENAMQTTLCCIPPACQRCLRASLLVPSLYQMLTGPHRLCNPPVLVTSLSHPNVCELTTHVHLDLPPCTSPSQRSRRWARCTSTRGSPCRT